MAVFFISSFPRPKTVRKCSRASFREIRYATSRTRSISELYATILSSSPSSADTRPTHSKKSYNTFSFQHFRHSPTLIVSCEIWKSIRYCWERSKQSILYDRKDEKRCENVSFLESQNLREFGTIERYKNIHVDGGKIWNWVQYREFYIFTDSPRHWDICRTSRTNN